VSFPFSELLNADTLILALIIVRWGVDALRDRRLTGDEIVDLINKLGDRNASVVISDTTTTNDKD
jgi:hypothetical protein